MQLAVDLGLPRRVPAFSRRPRRWRRASGRSSADLPCPCPATPGIGFVVGSVLPGSLPLAAAWGSATPSSDAFGSGFVPACSLAGTLSSTAACDATGGDSPEFNDENNRSGRNHHDGQAPQRTRTARERLTEPAPFPITDETLPGQGEFERDFAREALPCEAVVREALGDQGGATRGGGRGAGVVGAGDRKCCPAARTLGTPVRPDRRLP